MKLRTSNTRPATVETAMIFSNVVMTVTSSLSRGKPTISRTLDSGYYITSRLFRAIFFTRNYFLRFLKNVSTTTPSAIPPTM